MRLEVVVACEGFVGSTGVDESSSEEFCPRLIVSSGNDRVQAMGSPPRNRVWRASVSRRCCSNPSWTAKHRQSTYFTQCHADSHSLAIISAILRGDCISNILQVRSQTNDFNTIRSSSLNPSLLLGFLSMMQIDPTGSVGGGLGTARTASIDGGSSGNAVGRWMAAEAKNVMDPPSCA